MSTSAVMDTNNTTSETYKRARSHSGESTIVVDMDGLPDMVDKSPDCDLEEIEAKPQDTAGKAEPGTAVLAEAEETYPEGGSRAWLVVLGSWMALFSSLGIMNTMATFQTYITRHQLSHYSEGTIGWIFSVYAFLCFFCGVYVGPVFDKYGPRLLVLTGTFFLILSLMLMSICTGMEDQIQIGALEDPGANFW
jgi:Sugar (and other) transporter